MKLARRDFLALGIGGTVGGALATATGLHHYYTRIKPYHQQSAPPQPPAPEGWLLTNEDLDAFAQADQVVESDQLEILDNTDIPGSNDFQMMRVRNLGECVAACEDNSKCQAFTYARSTHTLEAKRQVCWLKADTPEKIVSDLMSYVSGRR
ncbi:PAN domain-containing protein [Roseobacter sp. EG26]|uniref:PAN domain-containing protein n=1 Tax=Roseobacter sp. EG26 TaxID=3412477 RepID=UPI002624FD72|nr:PAN domain-containing protein [uncultured Roseobacter sp.]